MAANEESWPSYGTDANKLYRFRPFNGRTLRIAIKSCHDCHLVFTSAEELTTPRFEVFIGAWQNAASAIRFNGDDDLVKVDTPDILNGDEFREFWVSICQSVVRVGKVGESEPFMEATLPEQVAITHYGYSTGWGASGWWKFYEEKEYKTEDCLDYNYHELHGEDISFAVQCSNDAHIALTSGPEDTTPMYEIFLGAWENEKSAIRLNKDADQTVVKVDTPTCLNCEEERIFRVTARNGRIQVFNGQEGEPFMEYVDPEPWNVTHFGFCTGWGATGKWRFFI